MQESGQSSTSTETQEIIQALSDQLRSMSAQSVFFNQAVGEALGLNATDLRCLGLLGRGERSMTAGQLAEATGLTTGAITGVIDRLEKAGFVQRKPDPRDRRRVIVERLPEREPEIGALFQNLGRRMFELSEYYADDELRLILDFASRMETMLKEETARLREHAAGPGRA